MDPLSSIATGFGASAPAGWNPYLALLLISLGARFGWVKIADSFSFLTSTTAIVILVILVTLEVVADKVPTIDHFNDLIGTVIRPLAGAILFAAVGYNFDGNTWISYVLGAVSAGSLHAIKASTRPLWTITTGGLANPVVSVFEDLGAGTVVILAMLAPLVSLLILVLLLFVVISLLMLLRRRVRRRPSAKISKV
ncbi:conserved hypothetical membrane spanning protein [Thermobaculum terrenum ATCC BAA-798]|uniref:Conserved hypothetical membrane spanning protein n=1 Tax=Thermobaculum terrenum (strain ATCC BAA-798 / CCMEE 7001 / YNP1) TaxID=525904 RepID=D1CG61_THET1|nr:DUF4126 domain-containing protein [Thermobaculum terrenum]ACZ41917.1 conserved hypothetical membrane spanning protein [Thermobaculum terrenum ATCC BAA-798]